MLLSAIPSVAGSCATRDTVEDTKEVGKVAGVVGRLFRNIGVVMASSRLANGDPALLGARDGGAGDAGGVDRVVGSGVSGSKSAKSHEIDVVLEDVGLPLRLPL